jgi:anaerobic magnesium-protoporphyrin IX monomethyl ester cyclase
MSQRLLLAACSLADRWQAGSDRINGHYPLGLGSLHAVAERAGHQVETKYLVFETTPDCISIILETIERTKVDVLGLSVITDTRVAAFRVIEAVYERFPDIHVVLGGVHVSVMYAQILRKYPHVVAVIGEGEMTLLDLLEAFEAKRDLASVDGIAFWRDDKVVKTKPRAMIEDLDTLPMPRHDLFYSPERATGQLMTSRGCPFTCSFCVLDTVSRRKIRAHSVKRVVDEIEAILRAHPQTKQIWILDDQFFADNKRVIAVCNEIVKRGIKCDFYCQGRVKPLSREVVLALERAGFFHVTLGLESGSPKVLERCHKKITTADVERALKLFAETKIHVMVLLIIGLPGETMETINETIATCKHLQKTRYHFYSNKIQDLFIYPGTEIYEIAKAAGAMDDDYWLGDGDCPRFEVENDAEAYAAYRKALYTHLSFLSIDSKEGFAAQRELIPDMLKWGFNFTIWGGEPLMKLAFQACQHAIAKGRLSFVGKIPESVMVARRQPGADGVVVLKPFRLLANTSVEQLVTFAYREELPVITRAVDRAVEEFIEETFKTP